MPHKNILYICSMFESNTDHYVEVIFPPDARNCTIEGVRGEQITYTVVATKTR